MSLTFNCLDSGKSKSTSSSFNNARRPIVVLSTPPVEFKEFVLFADVSNTEMVIFANDEENVQRFITVQGDYIMQSIRAAYDLDNKAPVKRKAKAKIEVKINCPQDLTGRKLIDVLPNFALEFLLPMYQQTLTGHYLQTVLMWLEDTILMRTFPIFDAQKNVVGGCAVSCPYNTKFNGDISRYIIKVPA